MVIDARGGSPVRVRDVAEVRFGHAIRYGAMTRNGEGETVGGVVLMLKGANALATVTAVKERVKEVEHSLPEGVYIDAFVDRSKLVDKTIGTVEHNLLMGALIVIVVLVFLLGNWRAGLIVASVIPLALLFAIGCMVVAGQSANLMSMGALDFGLIVDGAVIVTEGMLFALHQRFAGQRLSAAQLDSRPSVARGYHEERRVRPISSSSFMFPFSHRSAWREDVRPMAFTVSFAIIGARHEPYLRAMGGIHLHEQGLPKGESWSERNDPPLAELVCAEAACLLTASPGGACGCTGIAGDRSLDLR